MKISEIFKKRKDEGRTVLSFEIFPPKKEEAYKNLDTMLSRLAKLEPDFISVTFGAGGSIADNKTIDIAKRLKREYGIEPLVHMTCTHYEKKDIDVLLDKLSEYSIENILALRGDIDPKYPIKTEFSHANELTEYIKTKGDFCISGACYPEKHFEAPDMETDIANLKKKVDAGAEHLITQLFFDNIHYFGFLDKIHEKGINVPMDAGIMPVTNGKKIFDMVKMCGATLPDKLKYILEKYEDDSKELLEYGIEYTAEQINGLVGRGVSGIHIYTMNKADVTERICKAAGIFL